MTNWRSSYNEVVRDFTARPLAACCSCPGCQEEGGRPSEPSEMAYLSQIREPATVREPSEQPSDASDDRPTTVQTVRQPSEEIWLYNGVSDGSDGSDGYAPSSCLTRWEPCRPAPAELAAGEARVRDYWQGRYRPGVLLRHARGPHAGRSLLTLLG